MIFGFVYQSHDNTIVEGLFKFIEPETCYKLFYSLLTALDHINYHFIVDFIFNMKSSASIGFLMISFMSIPGIESTSSGTMSSADTSRIFAWGSIALNL